MNYSIFICAVLSILNDPINKFKIKQTFQVKKCLIADIFLSSPVSRFFWAEKMKKNRRSFFLVVDPGSLYHSVGPFRLWCIGLAGLNLMCTFLFRTLSWTWFFLITLIFYFVSVGWGLTWVHIGSWKSLVSIGHRLCGIVSLLLPISLASFELWTNERPNEVLYLIAVICVAGNCIFGAFLISRRIPSFDIPTIRAFGVGVTLGLSFVGMSLMWR